MASGESPQGEKRKAEDGEAAGEAAAKRPRVEGGNGAAVPAKPAAKLGIDLEKLARAKAALQKQKELKEKLAKAGVTVRAAAAAAAWLAAPGCAFACCLRPRHSRVSPASPCLQLGKPASAASAPPAAAPAAPPKPTTKLPPPLILDEQGRQVDATGKPIERPKEAPGQAPGAQQQEQQANEEDAAK